MVNTAELTVNNGEPSPKFQVKVVKREQLELYPRMVVFVNKIDVLTHLFVGTVKLATGPLYTFIGFTLEKELSQKLDALILKVKALPG